MAIFAGLVSKDLTKKLIERREIYAETHDFDLLDNYAGAFSLRLKWWNGKSNP